MTKVVLTFQNVWLFVILSACAGVGVVYQSDPLIKLNDAEVLFMRRDRPVIAERLIREATEIYRERDDPHGLGNAYREYADLLRSPAVTRNEGFYTQRGFLDKSFTFDNRFAKATELYMRALDYYRLAETRELSAGTYDVLTNTYYNMAHSNLAVGANENACRDYTRALQAYQKNMEVNPAAHPAGPKSGSIPDAIASLKLQAGCQ